MSILKLYLDENLENLNKQFIREAIKGDTEEAKKIIAADPAVVNYQDEVTGLTGLMIFAADGCYSMVDHICEVPEADVSLEANDGRCAGIMALTMGREDIMLRINERIDEDVAMFDPETVYGADIPSGNSAKIIPFGKPKSPFDPSP